MDFKFFCICRETIWIKIYNIAFLMVVIVHSHDKLHIKML